MMDKLENTQRKSQNTGWLLLGLVLLTLVLRLFLLGEKPLWLDEAKMVMLSTQSPQVIFFGVAGDIHPPAGYLLLHYWMQLFGDSEFAVRFPSALFLSLSLIPILLTAQRISGKGVLLWVGLAFALSPYTLYVGQEVRTYAYLCFFCAWLLYFTVLIVQGYGWKGYFGFGVSSLSGLWLHHLSGSLIGGMAIFLIIYEFLNRKERWWWVKPTLTFALTLLIYLPQMLATFDQIRLFMYEVKDIQETGISFSTVLKCLGGSFFHFGSGFYFTSVDSFSLQRMLTDLGQTGFFIVCCLLPQFVFLFGILAWAKMENKYRWLLLAGFIPAWLVIGYFLNSARQFVPVIPVYIIIIGLGLHYLNQLRWGKFIVIAMFLFNGYIVVDYYLRPIMPTQHRYMRNYRQAAKFLIDSAQKDDFIYLHLDHYSVLDMEYYLKGSQITVNSYYREYHFEHLPHSVLLDYINQVDIWKVIDQAHAEGKNVWLVANDPRETLEKLMFSAKDFNIGVDSDKACDRRLLELDQHYPQSTIKDAPGDILHIIYIPKEESR